MKSVLTLESEKDKALFEVSMAMANQEVTVSDAVKAAKREERSFSSRLLSEQKALTSSTAAKLHAMTKEKEAMSEKVISSERTARLSVRETNTSLKRARQTQSSFVHLEDQLKEAVKTNKSLEAAVIHLEAELDKTRCHLISLGECIPVKVTERKRHRGCGPLTWPLFIWELILEQLVSGTPPTSVNNNIVAHVTKFSPSTKIKELPSIWTICRARTVLLVIVQTLAAYHIAKADKWGQLFLDETMRPQVSFQNLTISVEEDEIYK